MKLNQRLTFKYIYLLLINSYVICHNSFFTVHLSPTKHTYSRSHNNSSPTGGATCPSFAHTVLTGFVSAPPFRPAPPLFFLLCLRRHSALLLLRLHFLRHHGLSPRWCHGPEWPDRRTRPITSPPSRFPFIFRNGRIIQAAHRRQPPPRPLFVLLRAAGDRLPAEAQVFDELPMS
jgi:hypothetical protein